MKRSCIVLFAAILLYMKPAALFSGVVVDCSGMTYSTLMVYVSNLNLPSVQSIVISSPFKSYEKTLTALDGPVYDFEDAGNKFQRGSVPTYLGDETALRTLAQFCWTKNIALYARVDLFHQVRGYNRNYWRDTDFLQDLAHYQERLIVDIGSSSASGGLSKAIGGLKRLPVQKWVVDVRDVPAERRQDYIRYLVDSLGQSVVVLSDKDTPQTQVAKQEDVFALQKNVFSAEKPDFRFLEKFSADSGFLHYIDHDSPFINNSGPLMVLLLQNCSVMVSSRMMNRYHRSLVAFIRDFGGYSVEKVSEDKILFYNQDKMIAVNYSDSFACWKQKKTTWRKGFFKAVDSGAVLSAGEKDMTFFLFPKSIACWDLRK